MQQYYGLSYKDAAHRLYHSATHTLSIHEELAQANRQLLVEMDQSLRGQDEHLATLDRVP